MANRLDAMVVLTGAGISAESGIPTFRGKSGIWQGYDPRQLATPQAFERDPELVWRFYEWRRELVAEGKPNAAHRQLYKLEQALPNFTLITQNVDGYHQAAGNTDALEIHGSLWRLKCPRCSHHWENRQVPLTRLPPVCPVCGAFARPDIVWFGETLEPAVLKIAIQKAKNAKLFVTIGTSSVVYPAAELPLLAKQNGAYLVEINPEETPISNLMNEIRRGPASVELVDWWENSYPRLNLLDSE